MKAAVEIEKSIITCKNQMMTGVLSAIEAEIEKKFDMRKLPNQYDYKVGDLVKGYYLRNNPTFPGISFFCKSMSKPDVDLCFRIEIGRKIVAGFITPLEDKYHGMQVSVQELQGVLNGLDIKLNGWWVYSEDLQAMDANDSPDFKIFNEAYYDSWLCR